MDPTYDTLIANEHAKIAVLKAKIEECERRIAVFQSMRTDDDFDLALTRKVEGSTSASIKDPIAPTPQAPIAPVATEVRSDSKNLEGFPRKALSGKTLRMLRFAGEAEKSIDEFLQFATEQGVTDSRQRVRALLHQYKSIYKLLESDRDGYFRLSDLGASYLSSLKRDVPSVEGGETTSAT